MDVFFKIGVEDPGKGWGRNFGGGWAVGSDAEVYREGGSCVYDRIYGGIHGCGFCGGRCGCLVDLIWMFDLVWD